MTVSQRVGPFRFMSDGSILIEDGQEAYPPGSHIGHIEHQGYVLESNSGGAYILLTPKGKTGLCRFEKGEWSLTPTAARPPQTAPAGKRSPTSQELPRPHPEPQPPGQGAPRPAPRTDGRPAQATQPGGQSQTLPPRDQAAAPPSQPPPHRRPQGGEDPVSGESARPGVTLSYRTLTLMATGGLSLLAICLYLAFFRGHPEPSRPPGGSTATTTAKPQTAKPQEDHDSKRQGQQVAQPEAGKKEADATPKVTETEETEELKQRKWWEEQLKLEPTEEQALVRLIANTRKVCVRMKSDLTILQWWFGAVRQLEGLITQGVEQNNEFASRELRQSWRMLADQAVTDAQREAATNEAVQLTAQIVRGGAIPRQELRAFQERLIMEANALRDLVKQEQQIRDFFGLLPRGFYAQNFNIHLTEAEAKALANPEVQQECVYRAFLKPQYIYTSSGEYTKQAKAGESRFTLAEAEFLDSIDNTRIPRWLFNEYGVMCELRLGGYEPERLIEDYETAAQAMGAIIGRGQMPGRPLDGLFLPTKPPRPPVAAKPQEAEAEQPLIEDPSGTDTGTAKQRQPSGELKRRQRRPNQNDAQREALRMLFGR